MVTWNFTTVDEFILVGLTGRQDMQILLFIVFLTCYLVTLIGNALIIWLSNINPRLHTPMYFFLRNLSCLDICFTSRGTECFLLLTMAYDRYVAICSPLRYTNIMHPILCIKMAAASWVGGFINAIVHTGITLLLPFCSRNVVNHFFCELPSLLELACADTSLNKIFIFVCGIVVAAAPFFFILITYVNIILNIMKIRTTGGRRKAFSTCASHVFVVTLFYGTIFFIYLRPGTVHVTNQDKMATLFYTFITPMLNPLIYTLRNKDVKLTLKETIRKKTLA
ncbi:hypothetical protein GDO78_005313 [Eleutherodactylus coqui]|uniref:G-protein coupled receptors family 1 profile domain-containing protein n=1 Tax=Eleutherodactylus coqui TaxID=57060 RepID=A0A8J6FLT2_ELECQ|nr:hypothetical protein GDO78_005313 [Eleutherodactylus coqui]